MSASVSKPHVPLPLHHGSGRSLRASAARGGSRAADAAGAAPLRAARHCCIAEGAAAAAPSSAAAESSAEAHISSRGEWPPHEAKI